VIVVEGAIDAHAAVMTVFKVLSSTNTTETAIRTMVRTFLIRHPQIADVAMVFTKLDIARNAIVSVSPKPQHTKNKSGIKKVRTNCLDETQIQNDVSPFSLTIFHLRLATLTSKALSTDDLFNGETINGVVCIFRGLIHVGERTWQRGRTRVSTSYLLDDDLRREDRAIIVADATSEGCSTAGGNHCAIPCVVRTFRTCQFCSFGLLIAERTSRS
jgi:hypothetical protein